jgi:hypothetical protein
VAWGERHHCSDLIEQRTSEQRELTAARAPDHCDLITADVGAAMQPPDRSLDGLDLDRDQLVGEPRSAEVSERQPSRIRARQAAGHCAAPASPPADPPNAITPGNEPRPAGRAKRPTTPTSTVVPGSQPDATSSSGSSISRLSLETRASRLLARVVSGSFSPAAIAAR